MAKLRRRDIIIILLTLALLMTTVVASALGNARRKAARLTCICHLKKTGLAFRIWANDHDNAYPMHPDSPDPTIRADALAGNLTRIFQVLSNELSIPKVVICPADTRQPAPNWESLATTNLSYFVGIDAEDTRPNMMLAGDRNLSIEGRLLSGLVALGTNSPVSYTKELHQRAGNIGLADGSVQQVADVLLGQQLRHSGDSTNRVLFPQ